MEIDKEFIEVFNDIKQFAFSRNKEQLIHKTVSVRTTPKIGRNELCSCGSCKKYKNCCIK